MSTVSHAFYMIAPAAASPAAYARSDAGSAFGSRFTPAAPRYTVMV